MNLEQIIRTTMSEAAATDGRLDQLVRAGLMPTSSLPLLKRAIARLQGGMALQGAERDVMTTFINSMMFIVLGDDTVFRRARTGAKSYAAEEVEELDETAKIVAHLQKRYGDNIRKSHVRSAATDFGVDASKLAKAVRTKLGKNMLGEVKDDDPPFNPPYRKAGEIRKDKFGNTIKNVPKFLAKKAMSDLSKKMIKKEGFVPTTDEPTEANKKTADKVRAMMAKEKMKKEEVEGLDELSKGTMGRYIKKAATKIGTQGVTAGLKIAKDERSQKNFDTIGKRERGISTAVKKLTREDIDAVKQMNESYKTAFETALNEYGIKSPSELDESKRKEFFNHVDLEFKKGDN